MTEKTDRAVYRPARAAAFSALSRQILLGIVALVVTEAIAIATAHPQPAIYPEKSIKFIVPFPAGGSSDVIARAVGQEWSHHIGKPIVIDNKGGANGMIGLAAVAQSAPDAYTIGMGATSTVVLNPLLYSKLPYDAKTDLKAVAAIASSKVVLVIGWIAARARLPYFTAL